MFNTKIIKPSTRKLYHFNNSGRNGTSSSHLFNEKSYNISNSSLHHMNWGSKADTMQSHSISEETKRMIHTHVFNFENNQRKIIYQTTKNQVLNQFSNILKSQSQYSKVSKKNNSLPSQNRLYSDDKISSNNSKDTNDKNDSQRESNRKNDKKSGNNSGLSLFVGISLFLISLSSIIIYNNYFKDTIKFVPDELNEGSRRAIEEEKELESASPDQIIDKILQDMEKDEESTGILTYFKFLFRSIGISIKLLPLILFLSIAWIHPILHLYWYKLFVKTFRSCGACFIKLGQWMATRPDLFPKELCQELGELHSSGDRHSFRQTKKILENAFGRSIDEIFEEFDQKELASGAIAQIYKGKLRQSIIDDLGLQLDSPYVAVKVRHPRVKEDLITDLRIIRLITKLMGKFNYFKHLNLEENVIVFSRNMRSQLNMVTEADNLKIFRKNFESIPQIVFPEPIHQLTTSKVLVESFEEGIPISQFTSPEDSSSQDFKNQLASLGIILYLKMLVVDNFLHADLHPGNLFVRFDVKNNLLSPKLVVLDAGLVCGLSPTDKKNFLDLFVAVTKKQGREVAEMMIYRSKTYKHRDPQTFTSAEIEKFNQFINKMEILIQNVIDLPFGEVQIGSTMSKVLDLGREYHVPVEANFTTLVIGSIVIEGLGRQLNPTLRFVEEAKPVLSQVTELREEWIKNRFENLVQLNRFKMDDIVKDVDNLLKNSYMRILKQKCE